MCSGAAALGRGALLAAYASTAGGVAAWQEARGGPGGPRATSPWRSHDALEPVAVCYYGGSFPCSQPPPPAGQTSRPPYDRLVVEVGAADGVAVVDMCSYATIPFTPPPER